MPYSTQAIYFMLIISFPTYNCKNCETFSSVHSTYIYVRTYIHKLFCITLQCILQYTWKIQHHYLYGVFSLDAVVPSMASYVDEMPVKLLEVLQTLNSLYPHHYANKQQASIYKS